nr:hypothetical protein [uncultured Roseibium sp.]
MNDDRRSKLIEEMAAAMYGHDGFAWDAQSVHATGNGAEPEQQQIYWCNKAESALSVVEALQ